MFKFDIFSIWGKLFVCRFLFSHVLVGMFKDTIYVWDIILFIQTISHRAYPIYFCKMSKLMPMSSCHAKMAWNEVPTNVSFTVIWLSPRLGSWYFYYNQAWFCLIQGWVISRERYCNGPYMKNPRKWKVSKKAKLGLILRAHLMLVDWTMGHKYASWVVQDLVKILETRMFTRPKHRSYWEYSS